MTHDELMALPDVTPQIGQREIGRNADGLRVVAPCVVVSNCGAFYQGEGDGLHTDKDGNVWLTGWIVGKHVRRLHAAAGIEAYLHREGQTISNRATTDSMITGTVAEPPPGPTFVRADDGTLYLIGSPRKEP